MKIMGARRRGRRKLDPYVYLGIVKNTEDPKNSGRVKVVLPAKGGRQLIQWARPANSVFGGAKDRGFFAVPAVESMVYVGFLNGDISQPYYMGAHWAANDPAGNRFSADVAEDPTKIRKIETEAWAITFDDRDARKFTIQDKVGASLFTIDGAKIRIFTDKDVEVEGENISAVAAKAVTVTTGTNTTIAATGNVSVTAEGNATIQADGNASITAGGNASITAGGNATVTATGVVSIIGSVVKLGAGIRTFITDLFIVLFNAHTHPFIGVAPLQASTTAAPSAPVDPETVLSKVQGE